VCVHVSMCMYVCVRVCMYVYVLLPLHLGLSLYMNILVTGLQPLHFQSTAIPDSDESLRAPSARQIILNEGDMLLYINGQMEITRGRSQFSRAEPGTVENVNGIERLYVSNRIEQKWENQRSARGYFKGYGM